jgi:hypothetical protein
MRSKTLVSVVSAVTAAALRRADYCSDNGREKIWVYAHVLVDFYNEVRVSTADLYCAGPNAVGFLVEVTRTNSRMALVAPIQEQCERARAELTALLEAKIAQAETAETVLCVGLRRRFGRPTNHYREVYQPNISSRAVEREFCRYDGCLMS